MINHPSRPPGSRKIRDITRELSPDILVFPGDPRPEFTGIDCGDYRITRVLLTTHSGTHIDAPAHLFPGAMTVDAIPMSRLTGPAAVIDCRDREGAIRAADLAPHISDGAAVLIRTDYSGVPVFTADYPYLAEDAARLLTARGVGVVGIDTPSVDRYGGNLAVHRHLLGAGTVIIELLDLSGISEGLYYMAALPLRMKNLDGSPARVVLFEDQPEER
ncbi:MAG: hypothetical protein APR53_07720 [Methanoculleus sp. SDB]|nr:MAG: hypothetical protein APR53_07720 [Methanoculleus sp. SDB]